MNNEPETVPMTRAINIAGIEISDESRACLCVDIGHNPGGDVDLALRMAEAAHKKVAEGHTYLDRVKLILAVYEEIAE